MARGAEFPVQADAAVLSKREGALSFHSLLDTHAARGAWRMVELWSSDALPFEARVVWTGGGGGQRSAWVTVSRAARICVHARALAVRVANLGDRTGRVCLAVADGFAQTHNVWEWRGRVGAEPTPVPVPPFAQRLVIARDVISLGT